MKKLTMIGGILIALLAFAMVLGTTFTFAQNDGTDTDAHIDTTIHDEEAHDEHHDEDHDEHRGFGVIDKEAVKATVLETLGLTEDEFIALRAEGMSLTEILEAQGVTEEEVEGSAVAAVEGMVETAVSDGTITQEQADTILEHTVEKGLRFGLGRGRHDGHGLRHQIFADVDFHAVIADALGISVEEYEALHDEGLHLNEMVEELGVDLADVEAAMQTAREDAINQAVEDGTITQEQADQLLSGEGHGHNGGHRGHQGGFNPDHDGDHAPATDAQDA